MSSGNRSLFLAADPAQSVEVGLRIRNGTLNDVFHSSLGGDRRLQVKDILQNLALRTNYRTHSANLALAKAIRKVLTRSFQVPGTSENALINGQLPQCLSLKSRSNLADSSLFQGASIVFLAPDENIESLKEVFRNIGINNDIFGVREAKGLVRSDSSCG